MWGSLSDPQKETYQALASKDYLRYQRELKDFNENGFFINSKGENSRDIYKPKLSDEIVQPKKPLSNFMFFNMEE